LEKRQLHGIQSIHLAFWVAKLFYAFVYILFMFRLPVNIIIFHFRSRILLLGVADSTEHMRQFIHAKTISTIKKAKSSFWKLHFILIAYSFKVISYIIIALSLQPDYVVYGHHADMILRFVRTWDIILSGLKIHFFLRLLQFF